MGKKNFYAAVIDAYQYSEVTEKRYKNFVDFAIAQWGEKEMKNQLRNYIDGDGETEIDWQEFFDEYYGYDTYYFALGEDGAELEDIEDNNVTLNEFCKKHKLLDAGRKNMNQITELRRAERRVFNASYRLSMALEELSNIATEIYGEDLQADLCSGGEIEFRRRGRDGYVDDYDYVRLEDIEKISRV